MGKIALLIVLLFITCCLCIRSDDNNSIWCIEEERQALLTFKHSFGGPYIHRLWSWQGRNCCGWDGVSCDKSTGSVFKLDLRAPFNESDSESYYDGRERLEAKEVNPSLVKLKYLKYLDLSGNYFAFSSIPQFLGQMKGLTYLNLSFALLSGRVPGHLGNLSNLEFLDLRWNFNLFVDDFKWVSNLSLLQHLDMGYVNLGQVAPKLVHKVLTQLPCLLHLSFSSCELNNTHFLSHPSINSTFLPPTLRYLDLSYNSVRGPIPDSLQNITSLEVLDFSSNFISSIPLWLGNLKNLEFLHLARNRLNSLHGRIELVLRNLSHLHSLDLSGNQFDGTIPSSLGRLSSLTKLYLSNNKLIGTIPSSLWRLSPLTNLDLSYNKLNGTISISLGRLSNLTMLDLSNNQLHGEIPETIGQLVNLRWLALDSNVLDGVIYSEHHLANLSSLKILKMGNNRLIKLRIEPKWVPPFQLEHIGLSSCKFEKRQFPIWLRTQNKVRELDLSNTSISDSCPQWLLKDKPLLETLDLSHNQINGPLPLHLVNGTNLLYEIIMTDNMLNGSIPNWFCNFKFLGTLDFSKNSFSGHIPDCLMNHQHLEVIDLSFNKISGIIPNSFQNMSYLRWLLLSNNNLTGPIPHGLSNVSLSVLDLGGNRLSGNIPTWIGERIPYLQILKLRDNMFNGIISPQLCLLSFLRIMDLANNDLEGSLPVCLGNLTAMIIPQSLTSFFMIDQNSSVDSNEKWNNSNIRQVLKGIELEYTTVLKYVVNMDLSGNKLDGTIPQELTRLLGLIGLNLAHNQLSGSIPKNFGDMRSLQSIDLSCNQLSGEIPDTLSALTLLSYLNLSSNNLEGKIPQGNQLQTLVDPSIYEGNPYLCGPPLLQACPENNGYSEGDRNEDNDSDLERMWLYIVVMSGYATGFWTVVGILLAKKRWRTAYFTYVDEIKDNVYVAVAVTMGALTQEMKKLEASQTSLIIN